MIALIGIVSIVILIAGLVLEPVSLSDFPLALQAIGGIILAISVFCAFLLGAMILEEPSLKSKIGLRQEIVDDKTESDENKAYAKIKINGYKEDLIDIQSYKQWLYFGGESND